MRSSRDNEARGRLSSSRRGNREGPPTRWHGAVRELKLSSMVNIGESPRRRHKNKPNDADRLGPKKVLSATGRLDKGWPLKCLSRVR